MSYPPAYRNRLLNEGPKADPIDAAKLCLLLKAGLLKEVYAFSETALGKCGPFGAVIVESVTTDCYVGLFQR